MPKSKEFVESDSSGSDFESKPKKKKGTDQPGKQHSSKKDNGASCGLDTHEIDGVTMYEIGTMRYASVFEFKGKKYVNIREYYEKDGKTLPGKKGIAINSAQWHLFKQCIDVLDEKMK